MGTRSTIAVQRADGSVVQTYCHWDGYVDHNGRILQEFYNSQELAEQLVSHGDMSSLGPRSEPAGEHSFDNPERGVTVYYGRDRGESGTEPRVFASVNEYVRKVDNQEYDYLFKDGKWFVSEYHSDLRDLEQEIQALEEES